VVIVLHDINFASHYADHICAVKGGAVVSFGTLDELMRDEVLTSIFDTEVRVVEGPRGRIAAYH
jgi:iron complex transport system ATP-binding protein